MFGGVNYIPSDKMYCKCFNNNHYVILANVVCDSCGLVYIGETKPRLET